jgi:hypothetical protein
MTVPELIHSGQVRPGDATLVRNGERGPLNAGIRWFQRRGLHNLSRGQWTEQQINRAAECTHAAVVLSDALMAEQYYPHARVRQWSTVNATLLFRRPLALCGLPNLGQQVAAEAYEDVLHERPYAALELGYYWFRFGGLKIVPNWLGWKRQFADVFRDKTYNTCAAEYVRWCQASGIHLPGLPESWYPARLAIDREELVTIGTLTAAGDWRAGHGVDD